MRITRLISCFVLFAAVTRAQDQPFKVAVDVRAVSLDVTALDSNGRTVSGLGKNDFVILEDGAPQEVIGFEPVETAYNVGVLFDCSGSTAEEQPLFADAAAALAASLRPQDDLVMAAFGSEVFVLLDRAAHKKETLSRMWRLCGQTVFYDALKWGVERLNKSNGRKGLVVFTDGRDSSATEWVTDGGRKVSVLADPARDKGFQRALKLLATSSIPAYFVAVNTDRNPNPRASDSDRLSQVSARIRMEQLAEVSGGKIVYPKNLRDIIPLYEQLGRELGSAYTLTYKPARPWTTPEYRRIEVSVQKRGVRITQSRTGYYPR